MTLSVSHTFVCGIADDAASAAAGEVLPSHWNATHTLAGTASAAQLNSSVVQSVVNDTNVTGSISAQALTLAWAGTLPSSRLDLTMSPTWTGNHTFNPTSGAAFTSTTASNGIAQVFNTNQTPGGVTNNAPTNLNSFTIGTDDINAGANFVNGWTFSHGVGNTGVALGGRQAMEVLLSFNAATNASNANRNYVALIPLVQVQSGDGGGSGTEKGEAFALNPYVKMTASAAHWVSAHAIEADVDIRTGATVLDKFGVQVTQVSTDAVAGSRNDAGFNLANQAGAPGWSVGFQIGDGSANSPVAAAGSIMAIKGSPTITNGIDMSGATFTGNPFKSNRFTISNSGDLVANSGTFNSNVSVASPPSGETYIVSTDGTNTIAFMDCYQNAATVSNAITARLAGGTGASPSGVGSAQTTLTIGARAYTSAGSFPSNNAVMSFQTVNAQSSTDQSSQIIFVTTPTGATAASKATALTIQASGGISVGTSSDPGIGLIYQNSASFMMRTKTSWNTGAAANTATLTNAPAAGNPTKWIPVDDNGTTRYIPAW